MNNLEACTLVELAELTGKHTANNPDTLHPATVGGTLRTLAGDDAYWDQFSAKVAHCCEESDLVRLRALLAATDDHDLTEPREFLGRLGLQETEIQTVVTEMQFESRRARDIQGAFTHADPAATALALTEVTGRENPDAIRERMILQQASQSGKMTLGYVIVMCALMSFLGLACSIALAPMYKGVSAD